jgi:hypothetical protein
VTKYVLPSEWHGSINNHIAPATQSKEPVARQGPIVKHRHNTAPAVLGGLPKMTTSYNSTTPPVTSPGSPQPPPYQLLNPNSQQGSTLGYTPFATNSYLSSAFSGAPPPVINVTNVYNMMPQPKREESNQRRDKIITTLLDGAVKVATSASSAFINSSIDSSNC